MGGGTPQSLRFAAGISPEMGIPGRLYFLYICTGREEGTALHLRTYGRAAGKFWDGFAFASRLSLFLSGTERIRPSCLITYYEEDGPYIR